MNLNDVRSMRSNFIARSYQASSTPTVHRVEADLEFTCKDAGWGAPPARLTLACAIRIRFRFPNRSP